jgi:hypothetical protein
MVILCSKMLMFCNNYKNYHSRYRNANLPSPSTHIQLSRALNKCDFMFVYWSNFETIINNPHSAVFSTRNQVWLIFIFFPQILQHNMQNHYAIVDVINENEQTDLTCCMWNMDRRGGASFITRNILLFFTFTAHLATHVVQSRTVGDD